MKQTTKATKAKASDKSEKVQVSKEAKEVLNFCKVLATVNNSSTKLTEQVKDALLQNNDLLTGTALYLYIQETSKSQRLNTLQRTIKRVSKSMSKEKGADGQFVFPDMKPLKIALQKKGEHIFYKWEDNTASEADKFDLLMNHIKRMKDSLTDVQKEDILIALAS